MDRKKEPRIRPAPIASVLRERLGGSIGTDWDILVSRSTDDGVTWTAAAALNSYAGTDSERDRSTRTLWGQPSAHGFSTGLTQNDMDTKT